MIKLTENTIEWLAELLYPVEHLPERDSIIKPISDVEIDNLLMDYEEGIL